MRTESNSNYVKLFYSSVKMNAKQLPSNNKTVGSIIYLSVLHVVNIYIYIFIYSGPPLWSSGQSSWLQIRRPGFDSRALPEKKVLGLERGPLSLVSTTEELLNRNVAAPV
jgi:hypothetical protein